MRPSRSVAKRRPRSVRAARSRGLRSPTRGGEAARSIRAPATLAARDHPRSDLRSFDLLYDQSFYLRVTDLLGHVEVAAARVFEVERAALGTVVRDLGRLLARLRLVRRGLGVWGAPTWPSRSTGSEMQSFDATRHRETARPLATLIFGCRQNRSRESLSDMSGRAAQSRLYSCTACCGSPGATHTHSSPGATHTYTHTRANQR